MKILMYKLNRDIQKYTGKSIKNASLKIDGNKYDLQDSKYFEIEPGVYHASLRIKYEDLTVDNFKIENINLEIPKQYSIRMKFYDSKDNFRNIFNLPLVWIVIILTLVYTIFVSASIGHVQLLPLFIVTGFILLIPSNNIYCKRGKEAFNIVFE